MKATAWATGLVVGALALVGCGGNRGGVAEQRLTGGGSSFVEPIMKKWAGVYYKEKNIQVDYTSLGSSNGIRQMIDGKNDFGCTDAPMTEAELKSAAAAGGEVLHVPLVMGGVVPAYNLKDVGEPLRFSGPVLAEIFLGKIKRWDDPRIKELNPRADLPGRDIAVVHRSDGSGTTYIWSEYLSLVSPEWKKKVGVGTNLQWPTGIGAPKNNGVAEQTKKTPGAIGYVELIYVLRNEMQYGAVQNRQGEFVRAGLDSVTLAAASLTKVPDDFRYSLNDVPGKGVYPICGTTWAVAYVNQPAAKVKLLTDFFRWITHEGQGHNAELAYARLSPGLVLRVEERLGRFQARK